MAGLLSSDILESQFGPTRLEILRQDDTARVILSRANDSGQLLELSQVAFKASGAAAFPDIHETILGGRSMGKAFTEQGVAFERQVRGIYTTKLPLNFSERFGVSGLATIVEVSIAAGPDGTAYADILEVYSPQVSWPSEASEVTAALAERVSAFDKLLTITGH